MSETCGAGAATRPDRIKIGTVGPAGPGVEIKLADDGELLVRSDVVMRGYRNEPDKTAEAIDADGWLHTGDIAEIDDDGYVKIVDRKKEIIINAAGKNMSPANIESALKGASPLIGQACVIGDARPLQHGADRARPRLRARRGRRSTGSTSADSRRSRDDERVRAAVQAGVDAANERLARVEQIKSSRSCAGDWAPGGDELTPTMKLKRKPIAAKYAAEIEALYAAVSVEFEPPPEGRLGTAEHERERAAQALTIAEHGGAVAESRPPSSSRLTALLVVDAARRATWERCCGRWRAEARRRPDPTARSWRVAERGTTASGTPSMALAGEDEDARWTCACGCATGARGRRRTVSGLESGLQSSSQRRSARPACCRWALASRGRGRTSSAACCGWPRTGSPCALEQARMRDRERARRRHAAARAAASAPPRGRRGARARDVPAEPASAATGTTRSSCRASGSAWRSATWSARRRRRRDGRRLRDDLRGFVLQGCDPAGVEAALDGLAAVERDGAWRPVLYAELDVTAPRALGVGRPRPPALVRDGVARVLETPGGTLARRPAAVPIAAAHRARWRRRSARASTPTACGRASPSAARRFGWNWSPRAACGGRPRAARRRRLPVAGRGNGGSSRTTRRS